jgi:GTP-binding protein HflX
VPELPREGSRRSPDARVEEAEGLAEAIGIEVVAARPLRVRTVRPATLLGKGQVEEIAETAKDKGAGLLIVDSALTPIQQKNLEEEVGTKVIDRTGLILEIFGERAATAEGRLQVELAHLDYQAISSSAAGPTLNASVAASASSAVPAKPRSRPTGD